MIESVCRHNRSERGVALLLVVFIIALGTLLVFELGRTARYDSRSARAFAERIQGNYVIRSGFNLAQIILAIPKLTGPQEDWLGDIWAQIGRAKELPVQGLPGTTRLEIVDESAKFNLNWLGLSGANAEAWRSRTSTLFNQLGFVQESFSNEESRTIGNISYSDLDQVAVISDWIDGDEKSYESKTTGAKGFESNANPGWFFNRELKNLNEALLIPGITRERLSQLIPFVRATDTQGDSFKVNVNTARYETLVALGYQPSNASDMILARTTEPINAERLKELNAFYPPLDKITTTKSGEYSVVVRVKLPNSVRWGRAGILVTGSGATSPRSVSLQNLELY